MLAVAFLVVRILLNIFGVVGVAVAILVELVDQCLHFGGIGCQRASQARPGLGQVLAQLLALIEGPLIIRLGAGDHRRCVGAVRRDRDNCQNDADDTDHHPHATPELVIAMTVPGMNLNFSHYPLRPSQAQGA